MSEAELNAALAAAQGEFPRITKSSEAKLGTYSYSYASLDVILDKCRPVLSKHGLAIVQLLEGDENGPALRTELRHAAGGVLGSSFPLPTLPQKPQELGSLLTYLRRYALVALLGVAAEDDDDGAQAQAATTAKPKPRKREPVAPPPREALEETPEAVAKRELKQIQTLFSIKGIDDREARLAFSTQVVGRTIESSKDLTAEERTKVIKQIREYDVENPQTWPFPEGY